MAKYAIGDIQGCHESLRLLLEGIRFNPQHDELWFVGDLVNRGPQSLETLRFIRSLKDSARIVLGNHDLHLLAIFYGGHSAKKGDTFIDILSAPDCEELCDWLRKFPLLRVDGGWAMTHAGIPHIWNLSQAKKYADEVTEVITGSKYVEFFENMYGNDPDTWNSKLESQARYRLIANYFTRMRFISDEGTLDFQNKGDTTSSTKVGYAPWFDYPSQIDSKFVFGHWAAINGNTKSSGMHCVDTGCVWGRLLTAMRLDDLKCFTQGFV